jgi:nitrogen fixation protein NifB
MHLAVAPRCNIKCGYCNRRHDCANESRPGVTSRLLTPAEAAAKVREVMASPAIAPLIKVVGIAGPGDPLYNEETFETFRLVGDEFPHLIKCLSTNGLLLPDRMPLLEEIGLHSLTVTLNALDPRVGKRIYSHVCHHGAIHRGEAGAALLIANQLEGIRQAAELGLTIKINTVLIPGVNDDEIPAISRKVRELGAFVMNIMPLIPQADFAHLAPPTPERLDAMRLENEKTIGQFKHCRQCRSDAIGLIGQDFPVAQPAQEPLFARTV